MSALAHAASLRRARPSAALAERLALGAVILLAIGIPLAVAIWAGVFSTPHRDDFAYYRSAAALFDSGHLSWLDWGEMSLIGHLLWAAPFFAVAGRSVGVVHAAGATASVLGLVAAYSVYRRLLPRGLALFGVATFAAFPVFAMLTPTYMTDVTALSAQLVCVALGLASLEAEGRRRHVLLALSLAVGLLAFTIREFGIAAPLAVLAGHFLAARADRRMTRRLLASSVAFAGACGAFYLWRRSLPDSGGLAESAGGGRFFVSYSVSAWFLLALGVIPALALGARTVLASLRQRAGFVVAAVALLAGLAKLGEGTSEAAKSLFLPSYVSPRPLPDALGLPPFSVPAPLWWLVIGVTLVAGASLAGFVAARAGALRGALSGRRLPAVDPRVLTPALFGILAASFVLLRLLFSGPIFDRYLLPVVPIALLFLLRAFRGESRLRTARVRAGVALGACGLLAVALMSDKYALIGARWHAGERLVTAGYDPRDVDAGFEWVGLHYAGKVSQPHPVRSRAPFSSSYAQAFTLSGDCATVASAPRSEPWMHLIGVQRYRTLLGLGERRLWLYRNERGCAAAAADGVAR